MKTTIKGLKEEYNKIEKSLHQLDQDFRGQSVPFSVGSESHHEYSEKVADLLRNVMTKIRYTSLPTITYKDKKADIARKVEESYIILSQITDHAMEVLDQTYLILAARS